MSEWPNETAWKAVTRKGLVGSNPTPSAFGPPKRTYGVTKSASRFAKATSTTLYYVYSLKCNDGYYVGCTDNLIDRIERHKNGNVIATANRLPIKLDFYFVITDKYKAYEFEKYLKSGSGRSFIKKHLI